MICPRARIEHRLPGFEKFSKGLPAAFLIAPLAQLFTAAPLNAVEVR